jgi:hypothetical protein
MVQAEQRLHQASLAELEARYGEELQSLREELAEAEDRYHQLRQDRQEEAMTRGAPTGEPPLVMLVGDSISDFDATFTGDGTSQDDSPPARLSQLLAASPPARLSQLIAFSQVMADRDRNDDAYEEGHARFSQLIACSEVMADRAPVDEDEYDEETHGPGESPRSEQGPSRDLG